MLITVGTSAVLWLTVLLSAIGLGSVTAEFSRLGLRHALWFGMALLGVLAGVVSLVPPVGSTALAEPLAIVLALFGVAVVWLRWRRRPPHGGYLAVILTLLLTLLLGGWMAIGEVRNYDTGLYHLQVIALQARDGVDPGIAALHDRFGFSSSLWAWGAAFEHVAGPSLGYRLVPGLFLLLLMTDVVLRTRNRRNRRTPGTWLVLLGTVPLLAYGISYPGRTFAGIGQDWVVAVLWLLACAYALDWFTSGRSVDMGTAVVIAAVAGTVRSSGWLLFAGLVLLWALRRRWGENDAGVTWWVGIISALSVATILMRDVLASGWLLFPASSLPVPVPWRVQDPSATAGAVQAWARSPFAMERAREFGDWFPEWGARLWTDWFMVWLLAALVLAAVFLALGQVGSPRGNVTRVEGLVALAAIQVVALSAWFLTAPDTRFAWGPIIALGGVIVIAPAGTRMRPWMDAAVIAWMPLVLLVASLGLSVARDGSWWWARNVTGSPIAVVEVPSPDVIVTDGLTRTVGPDDRCWRAAVPCVPWYAPGAESG